MISSRTPEGWPNQCPVCGHKICIQPSTFPVRDAPCPGCGTLLDFDESLQDASTRLLHCIDDDSFDELSRMADAAPAVPGEPFELRIDFGHRVRHISSHLLGKLIPIHRRLQIKGGRLILRNVPPDLIEVFGITKLDRILGIEDDDEDKDETS